MITRQALLQYLDEYLACDRFKDYAPNGLQVEGCETIKTVCTAVTASLEVIREASKLKADALIVHHGYFWRGEDEVITGIKQQRISNLIKHNINLLAYHLPLDCHLELGNNACLGKLFEIAEIQTHLAGKTEHLLWSGQLPKKMLPEELADYLGKRLNRTPLYIPGSKRFVQSIAWCSGAAQDFIEDAHRLGVDAYLSGEISERTYYQAKELGVHYYACGHHATERYGIQALGEFLSKQFNITHQFIDSNNPV